MRYRHQCQTSVWVVVW